MRLSPVSRGKIGRLRTNRPFRHTRNLALVRAAKKGTELPEGFLDAYNKLRQRREKIDRVLGLLQSFIIKNPQRQPISITHAFQYRTEAETFLSETHDLIQRASVIIFPPKKKKKGQRVDPQTVLNEMKHAVQSNKIAIDK